MRVIFEIVCGIALALVVCNTALAKEWRGISPLQSTRADVEKLLGPSPPPPTDAIGLYKLSKSRSIYFLDEGRVTIDYLIKDNPKSATCTSIPDDTVLLIKIYPRKKFPLSALQLDESRLKKTELSSSSGPLYLFYADNEEGISIETQDGIVDVVNYFPMDKDWRLCPILEGFYVRGTNLIVDFFTNPKPISRKVVVYSNLSLQNERLHLDKVAKELAPDPHSMVHIIGYAGLRSRAGEAMKLTDRAQDYLVKERSVNPDRILTVDGGLRDEASVEIYIVPPGASRPVPKPTRNPR